MIFRILILIPFFYILTLLQVSFLFSIPLVLISVVLINVFEKTQNPSGLLAGFIGGFFLDIFSTAFIGYNVLILLALSLFIKIILRKYVKGAV